MATASSSAVASAAADSSAPASPASTSQDDSAAGDEDEERELKAFKKSVLLVWNEMNSHRFSHMFGSQAVSSHDGPDYQDVVRRPMDMATVKRNVENGNTRNIAQFQRDVYLMFSNATMYYSSDSEVRRRDCRHMTQSLYLSLTLSALRACQGHVERRREAHRRIQGHSDAGKGPGYLQRAIDKQEFVLEGEGILFVHSNSDLGETTIKKVRRRGKEKEEMK